jgi:uncharacterized protein with GYD domain
MVTREVQARVYCFADMWCEHGSRQRGSYAKGWCDMAGYVILGKFRQGPPDMSNVEQDISALKTGAEKLGARIVGLWALMGRFDVVIVVDAPDEMRAVGVAGLAS